MGESGNSPEDAAVLLEIMKAYHGQLHQLEATANKVTLTVAASLAGAPALLVTRIQSFDTLSRRGITILLTAVMLSASMLISTNREHANWLKRAIVRIQQALGCYAPNRFFSTAQMSQEALIHWTNSPILLPYDSQRWGDGHWLDMRKYYLYAIWGAFACGAIFTWTIQKTG